MIQPDLFTYPLRPGYKGQAETSKEAAEAMAPTAANVRGAVLAAVRQRPLSVHQCAAELDMPVPTVQPRFSELLALGLIEDTGERRKNASGRNAVVWRAVR